MARSRKSGRKDFPANLYRESDGRFRYRNPLTKKTTSFGKVSKLDAFKAANKLNGMLYQAPDLIKAVTQGGNVGDYITRWKKEVLPTLKLAESSRSQYAGYCITLKALVGAYRFSDLTTKIIFDSLADSTPSVRIMLLSRLRAILNHAIGAGELETSPADKVGAVEYEKTRLPLTEETFRAVREVAPQWLKNTMDIALLTLQREGDVINMLKTAKRDGCLYVIQQKTKQYPTGHIKIKISPALAEALDRCRDNVISPYIIHKPKPDRGKAPAEHWSYISTKKVMKAFKIATKACGEFDDWEPGTVPTFHEIRGLGIRLIEDQEGELPQELAGHADIAQTAEYAKAPGRVKWIEAEATLRIKLA